LIKKKRKSLNEGFALFCVMGLWGYEVMGL